MMRRYRHEDVHWIDLESPTEEEMGVIADEFSISPALVYELVTPTQKPVVDIYPTLVYAVFHFPMIRQTRAQDQVEEIDVILGRDYLLTVHYGPVEAIDDFARAFEVAELLKRGTDVSSGYLLLELTGRLYHASEIALDAVEQAISDIEKRIFTGHERDMVTTISRAGRELVIIKRILGNHSETLKALETASITLFGEPMKNYFHGVAALHYRAHARAVAMTDTVAELRETNLALLSTRQNEIMKNLTVITAIILPLTLVTNIFSMNTTTLPFIGSPNDFWIVMGIMAALVVLFVSYFKLKKWF